MKKSILLLPLLFGPVTAAFSQIQTDTIYYDKNWKGIESPLFATYYKVIEASTDTLLPKNFRNYYHTGELQAEGYYIKLDRADDLNSVYDGAFTNYFRSGKISQQGNLCHNELVGEFYDYREDGQLLAHGFYKDGELDGLYTEYSEENDWNIQIDYQNGEPVNDYYLVEKDGIFSKLRFDDGSAVYDSPYPDELRKEYHDGIEWPFYSKDGIFLSMNSFSVKDYGKYYQLEIILSNNSLMPFLFDPARITATLVKESKKENKEKELKIYTSEEYLSKVKKRQNWLLALAVIGEGGAASNAGYSTTTVNTTTTSSVNGHLTTNYSTSVVESYDPVAAYLAQMEANNRIYSIEDALMSDRINKNEGYLKTTTVYPGETLVGYVNVERKKGDLMTIQVPIEEAVFTFPFQLE